MLTDKSLPSLYPVIFELRVLDAYIDDEGYSTYRFMNGHYFVRFPKAADCVDNEYRVHVYMYAYPYQVPEK